MLRSVRALLCGWVDFLGQACFSSMCFRQFDCTQLCMLYPGCTTSGSLLPQVMMLLDCLHCALCSHCHD